MFEPIKSGLYRCFLLAEHAFENLMFSLLMGRTMRIMWADRNPALRTTGVGNIIIQGLAKDICSLALYDTFSRYGTILSCKVTDLYFLLLF